MVKPNKGLTRAEKRDAAAPAAPAELTPGEEYRLRLEAAVKQRTAEAAAEKRKLARQEARKEAAERKQKLAREEAAYRAETQRIAAERQEQERRQAARAAVVVRKPPPPPPPPEPIEFPEPVFCRCENPFYGGGRAMCGRCHHPLTPEQRTHQKQLLTADRRGRSPNSYETR